MTIESHDQVQELLPLYVLGALEPDELLAVEEYLARHPELAPQLRAAEEAAALLAVAPPDAPLPADARQVLLERVRVDAAAPETATVPTPQVAAPARVLRLPWPRVVRWGALAAALALAVYVGQLQGQVNALRAEVARLQETATRLQQQVQSDQQNFALVAVAERSFELIGLAAPEASGTYFLSGDQGVLVVRGLQPLPAQETYQLWLVKDGRPISVGLLGVQPNSPNVIEVRVPPEARDFVAFDVSIEPAGGSPTLLGPVVLQWKAPQPTT
jgi:anti-sigma-K factor RskA